MQLAGSLLDVVFVADQERIPAGGLIGRGTGQAGLEMVHI